MPLQPVIPTSNKVPGTYIQVSFGVGPSSAGDAPRRICITGNMTSSGTATVEKTYLCLSADDAKTLWGAGSEMHLEAAAIFAVYPSALVYGCAITESAGTESSGTLTYAGTATAAGAVTVQVNGQTISVAVASGDAAADVATAVEAAIDDQTDWPVTASVATAVVTVTFKHKGPRGDYCSLRGTSDAAGITVTPSGEYLGSGATDDDPANALTAMAPLRYHYIVAPYSDSTNLADYKSHCVTYAEPLNGRRQVWCAGSLDTLANTTTLATALNDARGNIAWLEDADALPCQIAAAYAALRCYWDGVNPAYNYDGKVLTGIPAQNDDSDRADGASLASALDNGITPLISLDDGTVKICRAITTRSQDASSNPSYSVLDVSKVTVPDYVADDIAAVFGGEQYANRNIDVGDDEGNPLFEAGVTARMVEDVIYGRLKNHEANGYVENVDANRSALKVQIAESPAGRFIASVPVDVVEGHHQTDVDVRQVG